MRACDRREVKGYCGRSVLGSLRFRGFTLIEVVIALAIFVAISAYLADAFIFASKAEQAVSKKAMTARTLQYIQARIRRDAEWARKAKVLPGGPKGTGVEFSNFKGEKRVYQWTESTKKLKLPDLTRPTQQIEYDQAKFRFMEFYANEAGGEGLRVVMAPLPMDERDDQAQGKDVLWGVAMVARTEFDFQSVGHRYKSYNEHFYPAGEPRSSP